MASRILRGSAIKNDNLCPDPFAVTKEITK